MIDTSDLELNEFEIQESVENQTQIVVKYGRVLGKIKSELMIEEEELKILKTRIKLEKEQELSRIEIEIRKSPFKFGVLKQSPSESVVKAIAKIDQRYIDFCDKKDKKLMRKVKRVAKLIDKEGEYSAYVKAADQKRSMITEEIRLLIGGHLEINTGKIRDDYQK